MKYNKSIELKDGRSCIIRNGDASDSKAVLSVFNQTHRETDFMLSYPDESGFTVAEEADFLKEKSESDREIEILAEVGGIVVGTAGISAVGSSYKLRPRAEYGIGILREYWGLGIGRSLTAACIECAEKAGYAQLELTVVADNSSAVALYESFGFREYGRNPRGFNSRISGWQELILMRLELN